MRRFLFLAEGAQPVIGYGFTKRDFHDDQLHQLGLPYGVKVRTCCVPIADDAPAASLSSHGLVATDGGMVYGNADLPDFADHYG